MLALARIVPMTFSSRAVRVLGTGYTSGGASERLARGPVLAPGFGLASENERARMSDQGSDYGPTKDRPAALHCPLCRHIARPLPVGRLRRSERVENSLDKRARTSTDLLSDKHRRTPQAQWSPGGRYLSGLGPLAGVRQARAASPVPVPGSRHARLHAGLGFVRRPWCR